MATVTREPTAALAEPRIVHPLTRLRQAIRTYVTVEGLALCVILACLWFWLTLGLDYGVFRLFGMDYLRDGSTVVSVLLRAIFLGSLLGGLGLLVGYKIVYRLTAIFRGPALALVFERRFPKMLGDRLVTAVELAGAGVAERYGYSSAMIHETTQAAAERAEKLSVRQVLNWPRLLKRCGLALVLLLSVIGLFLVATDTSAVWLEREVLLRQSYWPTQTMLEMLYAPAAVPHGGEARIGLRAWKWVAATRETPEGWRPLHWDDLWDGTNVPWELRPPFFPREFHDALPGSWKLLPLDQVETRVRAARSAAGASTVAPEVEAHWFELGSAVLERLRSIRASGESRADEITSLLLPEAWRPLSLDQLQEYLHAARGLTAADLSVSGRPWPAELAQRQASALMPLPVPIVTASAVELVPGAPAFGLDAAEKGRLPAEWRHLPARELAEKLSEFQPSRAAEQLGRAFVDRLVVLFDELEERAKQTAYGRRSQFRRLDVPTRATVESEQILTAEERQYAKSKFGTYDVRKQPESNDFAYDFKKLERPVRFRVRAGDAVTAWRQIDLVPLPTLKTLVRYQTEPGYLHGSNEPVTVGPFVVALEGEESRFDVRAGSLLRLQGESFKRLQWLRIIPEGQTEFSLWSKLLGHGLASGLGTPGLAGADLAAGMLAVGYVENENPFVKKITHVPGEAVFQVEFQEIGGQDIRLRFEFGDTDGVGDKVRLQHALGVAWHNGKLFVADTYNSKIKVLDPAERSSVTFLGGDDGWLAGPLFDEPGGLSFAGDRLYVADTNAHRIRVVDLKTKAVTTLKLQGVEAPKPPEPDRPSFPNPTKATLPAATVTANGDLTLAVELRLPAGWKLNPDAKPAYVVETLPGAMPAWSETKTLDEVKSKFDVKVPAGKVNGAGGLRLSLVYYECTEGKEGLCRIKSQIWDVPLKFDAAATNRVVQLTGPTE